MALSPPLNIFSPRQARRYLYRRLVPLATASPRHFFCAVGGGSASVFFWSRSKGPQWLRHNISHLALLSPVQKRRQRRLPWNPESCKIMHLVWGHPSAIFSVPQIPPLTFVPVILTKSEKIELLPEFLPDKNTILWEVFLTKTVFFKEVGFYFQTFRFLQTLPVVTFCSLPCYVCWIITELLAETIWPWVCISKQKNTKVCYFWLTEH